MGCTNRQNRIQQAVSTKNRRWNRRVLRIATIESITLQNGKAGTERWARSISLSNIDIAFDDARNQLELLERYP
jgi:phenylacetate-coenzyme A ligase PaaK-like adenylate-forming protein